MSSLYFEVSVYSDLFSTFQESLLISCSGCLSMCECVCMCVLFAAANTHLHQPESSYSLLLVHINWNTWNCLCLPLTLMVNPSVPLSLYSLSSSQNILLLALYSANNLMCCHFVLQLVLSFSNSKCIWYNWAQL